MPSEFKEIFYAEIVSVTGGVVAGLFLALFLKNVLEEPGLLILLPGFLAMRGSISGSLAARLSTALHLGSVRPGVSNEIVKDNVAASITLSFITSLAIGIGAFIVTFFVFNISNPKLILIALGSALISNFVLIPVTTWATMWLFRHKLDPDNIMGPYITTVGDIVSVLSLLAAVVVV